MLVGIIDTFVTLLKVGQVSSGKMVEIFEVALPGGYLNIMFKAVSEAFELIESWWGDFGLGQGGLDLSYYFGQRRIQGYERQTKKQFI